MCFPLQSRPHPTHEAMIGIISFTAIIDNNRAGGKGMAGAAMAVPDLREKKWRRLDSNLRMCYRVASDQSES